MRYYPMARAKGQNMELFTTNSFASIDEALVQFEVWNESFHMTEMWIDVFTPDSNKKCDTYIVKFGKIEKAKKEKTDNGC